MSSRLEDWAPRASLRLRSLPAKIERRLRVLLKETEEDAKRRAPVRSGNLRRSVFTRITARQLMLGSSAPYARIIEEGGLITPKRARYLSIPIGGDAKRLAGPRSDGKLFVLRMRDGRLFLARRDGKTIDIRWRLVSSVRRKARPFLGPAFKRLVQRLPGELGKTIADGLLKGSG